MLKELSRDERLLLMKFVCSFAWADQEVEPRERALVRRMMTELDIAPEDALLVETWLKVPPEVDPQEVPRQHRRLFLDAVRSVIAADGKFTDEENELLRLFEQLTE